MTAPSKAVKCSSLSKARVASSKFLPKQVSCKKMPKTRKESEYLKAKMMKVGEAYAPKASKGSLLWTAFIFYAESKPHHSHDSAIFNAELASWARKRCLQALASHQGFPVRAICSATMCLFDSICRDLSSESLWTMYALHIVEFWEICCGFTLQFIYASIQLW